MNTTIPRDKIPILPVIILVCSEISLPRECSSYMMPRITCGRVGAEISFYSFLNFFSFKRAK